MNNKNKVLLNKSIFRSYKKINPWASQTYSKSHYLLPGNKCIYAEKAKGSFIFDIEGNKYLDLMNSLLPVILGYSDKDVNKAITSQLSKGTIFSVPSLLEYNVSKLLLSFFEKEFNLIRFAKNGSDVTSASIRLSRAHNNKKYIIAVGYHGWHDWYIGSTPRKYGVLKETSKFTKKLNYNDFDSITKTFNKLKGDVSSIIMEPMSFEEPKKNYLKNIRNFCNKNNITLIFDEIITGFRFAEGGSYKIFGIKPDIILLGKGIANGMPLSAIVCKSKYKASLNKIFFSGTFGGECLSLISCQKTINKIKKNNVIEHLWKQGTDLRIKIENLIFKLNLEDIFKLEGLPPWLRITCYDDPNHQYIKILNNILLTKGVITQGSFNINYTLNKSIISKIVEAYYESFLILKKKHINKRKYKLKNLNMSSVR